MFNWRFLRYDFIDPELPFDRAARRTIGYEAWQMASREGRMRWVHFFGGLMIFGCVALGLAFALSQPAIAITSGVLVVFIFLLFVPWMTRIAIKPYLTELLRESGFEICRMCGQWLRGLPEERTTCTECGNPRQPMLASRSIPWDRE